MVAAHLHTALKTSQCPFFSCLFFKSGDMQFFHLWTNLSAQAELKAHLTLNFT